MAARAGGGWPLWVGLVMVILVLNGVFSSHTASAFRENISAADKARSKIKTADHKVSSLIKRTENMIKQLD